MRRKIFVATLLLMFTGTNSLYAQDIDDIFNLIDTVIGEENSVGYVSGDDELKKAVKKIYDLDLTIFENVEDYGADNHLLREQGAKFFLKFNAQYNLQREDNGRSGCDFSDYYEGHRGLREYFKDICETGAMKGDSVSKKFLPKSSMTNAHVLTVLMQLINGEYDPPRSGHWASDIWKDAQKKGFTDGLSMDKYSDLDEIATRGETAILVYRAANYLEDND